MAKFQVIGFKARSGLDRLDTKTGEAKRAYSMLVVDGVFTDDQTAAFSCELAFFEGRDKSGAVTQPLPDVKNGETYEVSTRFFKERNGKLGVDFTLRPAGVPLKKVA